MERELYRQLYRIVWAMGQGFRCPRAQHSTWRIVMVYFWAVLHDRPVSWATQVGHWPQRGVHNPLPSNATLSRRLRHPLTAALVQAVALHVLELLGYDPSVLFLDGKPLPVGGLGGDPDTTVGYGAGKRCRGYKLHAICDKNGVPVVWTVRTMRDPEWQVAGELVQQLPAQSGYLVADGHYDKNPLYDQAGQCGRQLVATRHRGRSTGHRRQSPYRMKALGMDAPLRRQLLARRSTIDRMFGHLCATGGGLAPLPAWVRRQHRVQLWVQAKIILYCLRMLSRRRHAAQEVA